MKWKLTFLEINFYIFELNTYTNALALSLYVGCYQALHARIVAHKQRSGSDCTDGERRNLMERHK